VANVAYQFKHFNVMPILICFPDKKAEIVFREHNIWRLGTYWATEDMNNFFKFTLPIKRRFLDGSVQVKRHDIEKPLCGAELKDINEFHEKHARAIDKMQPDVVIFSDYNKGFFHADTARTNFPSLYPHSKTIVDPKKGPISKWKGCSILKMNASEAELLSGKSGWKAQSSFLKEELNCEAIVITFAGDKVVGLTDEGHFCFEPEETVKVDSVVGAGDCFAAIFAMAIGYGFTVPEAVRIAYRSGSVYVQHNMNRPVVPAELVYDRIVQPQDLANRDFKLVFTNGCFDVLHKGHLHTLEVAKSKGDKLVVAVNTDESVKKQSKGAGRPVVPLEHRMAVLAALRSVDFVVSFDEDTPLNVIKAINPDVVVKGGDYSLETIVGADIVPEVHIAPTIEGVSTSNLLNNYLQQQP
jgi:D-beta-D-heptose 7-phosphate kinase/D-beta-D-heptose 1-phosphate adenosyltransferase